MARERVVAGRFGILGRVGVGGMGAVYRALDHSTGRLVAVKEIHGLNPEDQERFARECAFLASLDEPGIVRYVAHGTTEGGSRYLAMEWVDGPTVADEIKRRGFRIRETVELGLEVAKIVSAVHRRGIVHRDIKPSNIVLLAGDHRRPKLLDFGVARLQGSGGSELTASGLVVGSAGYLSPEQVTGARDIDARADVFSIGCLLFKCLTGRVPFRSDDPIAVLLKISLEQAPRVSDFVPNVPLDLDDLVARLLARDRDDRPADAGEVFRHLAGLSIASEDEAPPSVDEGSITGTEQRLAVLLLARKDRFGAASNDTSAVTLPIGRAQPDRSAVDRALAPLGLTPEVHADGTVVLPLAHATEPLPQLALRAMHAALAIRAADPLLYIAVVAGRAHEQKALKVGETVDRGTELLTQSMIESEPGDIVLDATLASLVEPSFEVDRTGSIPRLIIDHSDSGVRERAARHRGSRASCVGREREIAFLRGLFSQTLEDRRARSALVVGDAGLGKSRVGHEIVRDIDRFAVEVWRARGDPTRQTKPFAMLAPLLLDLAGVAPGDPDELRFKKLADLVDAHAPGPHAYRIVELFADIAGVATIKRTKSPTLDSARKSPTTLGEATRTALADFIVGVTQVRPLFIALDDVQWADQATIAFLEATLRTLEDRPIFVLALARPEIATTFPTLFSPHRLQTVQLEPLSASACERIARELLGDEGDGPAIERIVQRASGNAFFVEELSRAVLRGRSAQLPESVLAVIDARLDALSLDERRALRAGAVYGRTFWDGGVRALFPRADASELLERLEGHGLLVRARRSHLRGQAEYTFRQELFLEAAYARIPEPDRRKAHRAAARWLEAAGERDPIVLADQYERGGDGQSAAGLLAVAAHLALEASDLQRAIELCERALGCGAFGEERGKIHVTVAEARAWQGRAPDALSHARDALARLPIGDASWCKAASIAMTAASKTGNKDTLKSVAAAVFSLKKPAEPSASRMVLFAQAAIELILAGKLDVADQALSQIPQGVAQKQPSTAAWFYRARAWRALAARDITGYGLLMKRSALAFDAMGDVRNACVQRVNVAYAALGTGHVEEAVEGYASVIELADGLGLWEVLATARMYLGHAKSWLGLFDEAEREATLAMDAFRGQRDEKNAAVAAALLARIMLERHRSSDAEEIVRFALALLDGRPPVRVLLLATLAQALAQSAQAAGAPIPPEALAVLAEAETSLGSLTGCDEGEGYVRWSIARVRWEAGDLPEAIRALSEAKLKLDERMAKITPETARAPFISGIPEHALTLALYRKLCQ